MEIRAGKPSCNMPDVGRNFVYVSRRFTGRHVRQIYNNTAGALFDCRRLRRRRHRTMCCIHRRCCHLCAEPAETSYTCCDACRGRRSDMVLYQYVYGTCLALLRSRRNIFLLLAISVPAATFFVASMWTLKFQKFFRLRYPLL